MQESTGAPAEAERAQNSRFTRRQALPLLGVTLGAGLFAGKTAAESDLPERAEGKNRGARTYNIRDFGAKGDGVTLDTMAVQAAVNACAADRGGTVIVPSGTFLIGTLELKSNVTLHIAADGRLLGSGHGKDYHAVDAIPLQGDSTLEDGHWALIYAVHAQNITVEGPGTIDGQGAQFHSPVRGTPPPSGLGGRRRPYHLLFYQCENLRVRNISLINSAYHSVRVIESKRAHMDQIYIHNRVNGNNDGFHFISAEHVTVSNCTVLSLDDACAMFGSCRNITITNSFFSTRWSVFRFGGGNAANIAVSNCILHQVYGCPIKFFGVPGNSFENMSFSDLVLDDVTGPICISIGPRLPRKPHAGPNPAEALPLEANEAPAMVRNISFSNIHGTVTTNPGQIAETRLTSHYRPGELHSCITLNCVGGATMENISFENIHLTFGGGGTAEDAARRDLPQIAGEYFMLGPMPAYGFYARNSRALTLNNIRFETKTPDLRPALILDNVKDVAMNGMSVQADAHSESTLRLINTAEALITAPRLLTKTQTFLQLEGQENRDIVLDGGDISKASQAIACKDGASPGAVRVRS